MRTVYTHTHKSPCELAVTIDMITYHNEWTYHTQWQIPVHAFFAYLTGACSYRQWRGPAGRAGRTVQASFLTAGGDKPLLQAIYTPYEGHWAFRERGCGTNMTASMIDSSCLGQSQSREKGEREREKEIYQRGNLTQATNPNNRPVPWSRLFPCLGVIFYWVDVA